MPTRRTSPRRTATRPSGLQERSGPPRPELDDEPAPFLAGSAPWLALLAVVLAAAALGFVVIGRGGDPSACRTAAWQAVPDARGLPDGWALTSTDLNANGMTISILGPAPADDATNQPVVYASVTCYGDAAATALAQNRAAAEAAGSTIDDRTANGEAYDIANPSTGSRTTLFRVGGLVGQVADGGTASPSELAAITTAVAAAMGDRTAAGAVGAAAGDPDESIEPFGSDDLGAEPSETPFAPELEALLPRSVSDGAATGSPSAPIPLSAISASASEVFGDDPSSRAFAARIRALGTTFDKLEVARSSDDSGTLDVVITGFRLPGADLAKLKAAILETWLSANVEGVTTSTVTMGGKALTKVDYGDNQTTEYVYAVDDAVIVIDTSDVAIATDIARQLK